MGKSDDDVLEDDESAETKERAARDAVCTCFKPLSSHDPAIIAAQLESFVSSDVSPTYHTLHALTRSRSRSDRSLTSCLSLAACCLCVTGH